MPARVLVIAFDAAEATLLERWMGEGSLPTFARLAREGKTFQLETPITTLPDAIWPEITTGVRGGRSGWCWYHGQVFAGEARTRVIRPGDFDQTSVWDHASRAGQRVAVLDIPLTAPSPGLNGVALREWGVHDTPFAGMTSDPPEFVEDVRRRYGEHPLPHSHGDKSRCDDHDGTVAYLERLLADLLAGVEVKARMLREILDEGEWDLFFASFSESHCVGHQYWHCIDEASPWRGAVVPSIGRAMEDVYAALDAGLAHVLEGAGEDCVVFALASHGMGPISGGWQVLGEVLVRLDYGSGRGTAAQVRSRLPTPLRSALRSAIKGRARRRLREAAGSLRHPLESPATRAVALPNAPCGAIRLNVKGRDPFGSIEPTAEYDAACEELIRELEALENTASGTPAVVSVTRADVLFGGDAHPNVPDLIVRFARDQPLIPGVRSPRIGTVTGPVYTRSLPRTGEHTPESRLWVIGPGIARGRLKEDGHVLDLTPTVLQALGVPIPDGLDGRPLPLQGD